jgi:hypothetical protein
VRGGKKECWQSSTYTWKKLANYGLKLTGQSKWQTPFSQLNQLRGLADLRNQMIHNFAGVSQQDLDEAFPLGHTRIMPTLHNILEGLGSLSKSGKSIISPYHQMNVYLGEKLRGV